MLRKGNENPKLAQSDASGVGSNRATPKRERPLPKVLILRTNTVDSELAKSKRNRASPVQLTPNDGNAKPK